MDNRFAQKAAVTVAFGISCVCGYIATNKGTDLSMGATELGNVSFFTPDEPTFLMWYQLALMVGVLVIAQWFPDPSVEQLLSCGCPASKLDVRSRLAVALLMNAVWSYLFSKAMYLLAVVPALVYLSALLSILTTLNTKACPDIFKWFLFVAPNVAHASWVLVMGMLTLDLALSGPLGLERTVVMDGDMATVVAGLPALAMCGVAIVCLAACLMAIARLEYVWSMVAAWVLAGIYRMQLPAASSVFSANTTGLSEPLAKAALWGACGAVLASAAAALLLIFAPEPPKVELPQPTPFLPQPY